MNRRVLPCYSEGDMFQVMDSCTEKAGNGGAVPEAFGRSYAGNEASE